MTSVMCLVYYTIVNADDIRLFVSKKDLHSFIELHHNLFVLGLNQTNFHWAPKKLLHHFSCQKQWHSGGQYT